MSGHVAMFAGTGGEVRHAKARDLRSATRDAAPVLILAGGTGGHIFPGIAVAQALRARGVSILWLGSDGGLETQLVSKAGFDLRTLAVRGIRGKGWMARLAAPFRIVGGVFAAWRMLGTTRPRSALAFGGFAAGPGGIAAWMRRIPLLVHEQNRVPGVTNRILSHFAKRKLCGFAGTWPGGEWIGNPVRAEIAALPPPRERFAGREGRLRLLVLGGSQGAAAINAVLPQILRQMPQEQRPLVRHQSGARHLDKTREIYAAASIDAQVDAFIDDMTQAYAWADLVVCRAGALTLAELCTAGLPAILVPFPAAVDDHQTRNASALVEVGAARLVAEGDAFAERLGAALTALCADGDAPARLHLVTMAEAARALAKPDAAMRIADLCLEVSA